MLWLGLLLILAGVVIIVRAVLTMIGRGGMGRETSTWTGFLGVALLGLGVAEVLGLFPG